MAASGGPLLMIIKALGAKVFEGRDSSIIRKEFDIKGFSPLRIGNGKGCGFVVIRDGQGNPGQQTNLAGKTQAWKKRKHQKNRTKISGQIIGVGFGAAVVVAVVAVGNPGGQCLFFPVPTPHPLGTPWQTTLPRL